MKVNRRNTSTAPHRSVWLTALLLALPLAFMMRRPPAGQWPRLLAVSLCIGVVHFSLSFLALKLSGDLSSPAIVMQSYVPMTTLLAHQVQPEILMGLDDIPAVDRLGYVFARTEHNIATWVHRGQVDVGAFSNIDWDNPEAMPARYRRDLHIIHRTASYPRALELVRKYGVYR